MEKTKRTSVKQIKKRLELQVALDEAQLQQCRSSSTTLDNLRDTEQSLARIRLCNLLLKEMKTGKDKR